MNEVLCLLPESKSAQEEVGMDGGGLDVCRTDKQQTLVKVSEDERLRFGFIELVRVR